MEVCLVIEVVKKDEEIIFNLETKNSMYQMKVDKYNVLKHLWYGSKTSTDMEYLLDYPDVGFSGQINEVDDSTYSLDTLPVEYSCFGVGDFRVPAISVIHSNGSDAIDLRYQSYSIKKGKYSIKDLPSVYSNNDDCDSLEIVLKDTSSDIYVILKYGVFNDKDIICRSAVIRNEEDSKICLNKAFSMCLDIPYGSLDIIHFHGRHAMERQFERIPITHNIYEFSSTRGTSSHQESPSIIICDKNCNEEFGDCFGATLMYSGNFKIQLEGDQLNQVRMVMGINPDTFSWTLNHNEEFYTPEVILSFSNEGLSKLSHNFHDIIRNNVCRGKYSLESRPVLINNWEATYFDFDAFKILDIANTAASLGIDMMVLDDGWFGKRDSDKSGLGDWYANEDKLKMPLKDLVSKVKSRGTKFGIWFEPEMISEDSNLYRNHPDWAVKIPGRKPGRSRNQLVIDITRSDVRDYLYESISRIIKDCSIDYIKWDFNRSISDVYTYSLSSSNQKEMGHRFVLGLYELLEKLNHDFPNLLIEGCCGGGGRFDAGMLYYCPQIWCSDNTDAYDRSKIQYGTSFIFPISTIGSHVSAVPNHQSGRITPLSARSVVAMSGSFGYELDLNTLSDTDLEKIKQDIKDFKKYNKLIHNGDYYRLSNPNDDNFALWEFVSDEEVLVQGIIFRSEANQLRYNIKLRGLDSDKKYIDSNNNVYTGSALMNGGILLPKSSGDYYSVMIHLKKQY